MGHACSPSVSAQTFPRTGFLTPRLHGRPRLDLLVLSPMLSCYRSLVGFGTMAGFQAFAQVNA